MIQIPDVATLQPEVYTLANGRPMYYFHSKATDLVKLDFLFEAGSAYQRHALCAKAANKVFPLASKGRSTAEVAEFLDYRGIIVEKSIDTYQSGLTVYMLRKYAEESLPLFRALMTEPAFGEEDFEVWREGCRQENKAAEQKTSAMARRHFYRALFGEKHPLGRFASVADAEALTRAEVLDFHRRMYGLGDMTIVAAGGVDDGLLSAIDECFGHEPAGAVGRHDVAQPVFVPQRMRVEHRMEGAAQTTLRIGRVLPLLWDDYKYAQGMLLTMVLGGYFGSRLMSNLREDKGFTYGIYARTQVYRGCIVFYITTDVATACADEAESEIIKEVETLRHEAIPEAELDLVRNTLAGDFVRSVDGIFERSARYCDMLGTDVTEVLTSNLDEAIKKTTATQLMELAQQLFCADDLVKVRCGC